MDLDTILKTSKEIGKRVVAPVALAIAGVGLMNLYLNHNVRSESSTRISIKRADGICSATQTTKSGDVYTEVSRFSLLGSTTFYTDKDGDGKVDRIHVFPGIFSRLPKRGDFRINDRVYDRERDLKDNVLIFEEADRDFQSQTERFEPYFKS